MTAGRWQEQRCARCEAVVQYGAITDLMASRPKARLAGGHADCLAVMTDMGCARCWQTVLTNRGGWVFCPRCEITIENKDGKPTGRGWVYALSNLAMPGLMKVGCTRKYPVRRARKISQQEGVPMPFVVEYAHETVDHERAEEWAHLDLKEKRFSRKEFFFITREEAIRAIREACEYINMAAGLVPENDLLLRK